MTEFFKHLWHEFELPLSNPVLVFSLILLIILLSPILLKKLNIPAIIGLIISGVVIGPHGLNLLEKNAAIDLFSTIGLLYIMFIAGLDLDMNEFKINKNKSFLFGFLTFIIPLTIGFPVCYYILGFGFNASLLTASMFSTHTLVSYPIVSKLGIAKNQAVAVAVGGTILTDTAVLILLAVIMGNSQGDISASFYWTLAASLLIFSAIMFLIVPRISKWFFKKLESEKHAHYIYVLAVVFFAAFLAEVAGVEKIIGAFVAGLVLNPLIPHSSPLMNRIEFNGNALFIPFFLISVGMVVDVRVILNGPWALIVAGTLTIVALFGKWLAALVTQLLLRYSKNQRQLIFGLSSSHAAATLAIILVGYEAHILSENILNGTIILILITCVVASFVTERASKKIVTAEKNYSSRELIGSLSYNEHILIPVENFKALENLLDFALLIKDKDSSNPVTLLSVVMNDEEAEYNIQKYRKELSKYEMQASASEHKINTIATIDFNSASGVVRTSREIMSDVLICEWPEKTLFFDKLFGDKTDTIIKEVNKNIFMCRFVAPLIEKNRMVFICPPFADLEFGFELILQKIARLASEFSMSITVLSEEKTFEAIQSRLQKLKLGTRIEFQLYDEWQDFDSLVEKIHAHDMIIVNSSRKGSVSFVPSFESLPQKLENNFPKNNLILVYPHEHATDSMTDTYKDFANTPAPIVKGFEAIENIGKGIGAIFKKNNQQKK